MVARYGVGVDQVDLDTAREPGIVVTIPGRQLDGRRGAGGGIDPGVGAEHPAGFARDKSRRLAAAGGLPLEGKAVGLYGLGAIGKQVARGLDGFDCSTIVAYDVAPDREFAAAHGVCCAPGRTLGQSGLSFAPLPGIA